MGVFDSLVADVAATAVGASRVSFCICSFIGTDDLLVRPHPSLVSVRPGMNTVDPRTRSKIILDPTNVSSRFELAFYLK